MSEKTFRLEIVTPVTLKYEGDVEMVQLPGVDGEMGILANHAPLLALLYPGVLTYRARGLDYALAVGEGFVKVAENKAVVMVDSAERAEDIDSGRVEARRASVQQELASSPKLDDMERLRIQLMLTLAQLKVASRRKL